MKRFLRYAITLVLLLCLLVPVCAGEETLFVGYDKAVDQLRQQLVERKTTAVVYWESTSEIGSLDLQDMLDDARAHTGVPEEGDYIRANMISCSYSVETIVSNGVYYHTCTFTPDWLTTAEQEAEVDAAVDALLSELDLWNATEYEKIKGAYDWITENVTYDYDWDDVNNDDLFKHSTYAAIIEKEAVCQGIASLYYRLCLELGVDCRYITGDAGQTETERHAWNIVHLEGNYYNCDPTWDLGLTNVYRYFLVPHYNFPNHTRDSQYDTAQFHAQYPMAELPYVQNVTASGTIGNSISWVLDGDTGTLTVSGTGAIPSYRFSDAPWKAYRDSVVSIVINEGITEVGERAFYWCKNCTSVSLPDSLTAIREYGFNNLRSLKQITLPPNLRTIEFCGFSECVALQTITLPDSVTTVGSNAFSNCSALTTAVLSAGMKSVPDSIFFADKQLRTVVLPEGITSIGDTAFMDSGIREFTIPSSVTSIGVGSFAGCASLQKITVAEGNAVYRSADGVLFSADGAHLICYPAAKYGSYTVPEGTVYIDYDAFRGNNYLNAITFPSTLKVIEDYAFSYCTYLSSVTFPANITSIGDSAFRSCTVLKTVVFQNDSVYLEGYTFAGCRSLKTVTLPAKLSAIPNGLFDDCIQLSNIEIPSTVTKIGSSAFYNCDSLISVTVPGNVKSIGQQAFDVCNKLETIIFEEGVQTLGWISIRNAPRLKKVVLPDSLTKIEQPSNTTSYMFDDCPNLVLYVNCGTYGYNYAVSRGLSYNASHPQSTRVVQPTCTEDGYTVYGCACGLYGTKSNFIAATGHDYVSYTVEPDCYNYGYTYHSCQKCWDYYETDYVEPRHSFGDWYVIYEATCENGGERERYCSWCGYWEFGYIPPTGHSYTSVATAPTCTEQGYTTHTCDACGDSYVDSYTDATGHTPGEPVKENEGAHGSHELVVYCSECGTELSREYDDGYLPGDINGDGLVNNKDLTRLFQYLADWDVEVVEGALDVNGDGNVNDEDLSRLFQYLSDYDVSIY